MPSQFALESMEILLIACVAVFALVGVVFPVIGFLAFLLFREEGAHAPAVPRVVAAPAPADPDRHDIGVPTAVAG